MKHLSVTLLIMLAISSWGQTDSKPYSRAAAEKSFRALVAAKDSDITDVIKSDGLVCFADFLPYNNEDRFLTIVLPKPSYWLQDTTVTTSEKDGTFYDGKTDFPASAMGVLDFHEWVNQDRSSVILSMLDGKWHTYGHYQSLKGRAPVWKVYGDESPVFRFQTDKDEVTGATNVGAMEDGTSFYASKTYANKNNGTTSYEMNVRLSTGRYKETWTPSKGDAFESVGNCYKAKEFARVTTSTKKTK
jgi:hypothetical protein